MAATDYLESVNMRVAEARMVAFERRGHDLAISGLRSKLPGGKAIGAQVATRDLCAE